jgi:hypothetical protein
VSQAADNREAAKRLRTRADGLRRFSQEFHPVRQERAMSATLEAAAILRDAAKETESPVAERYKALDAP